jgi:hypothetical protein
MGQKLSATVGNEKANPPSLDWCRPPRSCNEDLLEGEGGREPDYSLTATLRRVQSLAMYELQGAGGLTCCVAGACGDSDQVQVGSPW